MTRRGQDVGGTRQPRERPWRRLDVTRWPLWGLPDKILVAVLVVEILAIALIVVDLVVPTNSAHVSVMFVALVIGGMSVLHTESVLLAERLRRRVTESGHIDLTSVWTFGAALLLPPATACAIAAGLYTYSWLRVWRPAKIALYRHVFSTATVVLAIHAANGVVARFGLATPFDSEFGVVVVVLALLAYTVVNTCLVVGVVALDSRRSMMEVLGSGNEVVLEIATLSMGALAAAMIVISPPLVLLVLPALLLLHRAVLARQLETAANTDGKTGLLTAGAWQLRAGERLRRTRQRGESAALLILDIDHFKKVNDTHGHLTGDQVLAAVGAAVTREVRSDDLVGRYGGEEFVVLLSRHTIDHDGLGAIAERIRLGVDALAVQVPTADGPLSVTDVSVSVGAALYPADGHTTTQLMRVADAALYAAKDAGRNSVRVGHQPDRGPRTPDAPALRVSDAS